MRHEIGAAIREEAERHRAEMVQLLRDLVMVESPTDRPETQEPAFELLARAFRDLGFETRRIPGTRTGGQLYIRPGRRVRSAPGQLMVGHCDTVWPLGTLDEMPVVEEDGVLKGPGVFDMKGGLVQMIYSLRILAELGLEPPLSPLVFINSDEEIGSPESRPRIRRLARAVRRTFILEPAMGPTGQVKTRRKGVGRFDIAIRGRPAHAGLEPDKGASAILELSHVIQALHALNDPEQGTTVNVGVIDGGVRPNVVAPTSRAVVDVRVLDAERARAVEAAIRGLEPHVPGVTIEVEGGVELPPLELTPRNRALWDAARTVGRTMGLELQDATAGGASDGNTTSQFTATLDGLGPIGGGAHAHHEHVRIDGFVERAALLGGLLLVEP